MDEIINYIKQQRSAGFTDDVIKGALISAGTDETVVDTLLVQTISIPELTSQIPVDITPKKRKIWKWALGIFGSLIIGTVALILIVNPNLPADGNAIRSRALNVFLEKGAEFTKTNKGNYSGLCVFMSFNQSYRESTSNPEWEFKCFDSADSYAAELKYNDGSYRCVDNTGAKIDGDKSVINGPSCTEVSDK